MGIIKQLSASVINQIAAGEVVERPASVVKELLENALDAGATRVELSVERGGKDLVRVADDGRGIDADDLPLAFSPHATSKLSNADDLFRIATLGFRGEALAAIAEISKVRCQTRPRDAVEGCEVAIEAGQISEIRPCGCPPGTVIEVRNLFFNTPVRRGFLKADGTEAGHVAEAFSRVALARPGVQFTYRSGGKVLHELPAASGLKERIAVFFGPEVAESLVWVEGRQGPIHVHGYVAHPSQSRSSTKGQFLFIGGRFVRDRSLSHALGEAYRGLLMVGRQPLAFLNLEIPPEEVDVNVHPTKVEVRFRDSQPIYSLMLATIRKTFLSSDLHARLQAPPPAAERAGQRGSAATQQPPSPRATNMPALEGSMIDDDPFHLGGAPADRQTVSSWFQPSITPDHAPTSPPIPTYLERMPQPDSNTTSRAPAHSAPRAAPMPSFLEPAAPGWSHRLPPAAATPHFDEFAAAPPPRPDSAAPTSKTSSTSLFIPPTQPDELHVEQRPGSDRDLEPPPRALQLHDSYLVAETSDGMMVIDQHALHERILYEELRLRTARGGVESQRLLVPSTVDLPAADAAAVIEQRDALASLGIEIEPFGGDTIAVMSLPAMLQGAAPEALLRDLAEHLRDQPLPPTRDALLAELLHMVACKAAVKAGQKLGPAEIEALLARRHLVNDAHHCPHGRPTALVFSKAELEKQFGRI